MKFIEISELTIRKFQNLLDDVSEDDNLILAELELMAIEEIKSYLNSRFDTEFIFNQTGSKRSPLMKRLVLDFMLCFLYERTNSNEIPDSLEQRCEKNTEFLMDIAKGIINPDLPKLDPLYENTTMFNGGSESRFNNKNIDS